MSTNLENKIVSAVTKRVSLKSFEAYRLLDGAGDGLPEVTIDRYGPVALVQDYGSQVDWASHAEQLPTWLNLPTVLWRDFSRARQANEPSTILISGEIPQNLQVTEHGVVYQVSPMDQAHAGLFLDMREVRRRLREESQGKRLLNCFCFTGSLGLAAWCGGAQEVVQIDVSQRMLSWAMSNWEKNQNDRSRGEMRFIKEDCRDFLAKERRRVERGATAWDLVIIDPPTFGSSKGSPFQLRRHLPKLLDDAIFLLAAGGELLVTHNQRNFTLPELKEMLSKALQRQKRSAKGFEKLLPPTVDFTLNHKDSNSMRGFLVSV